MLQHCVLVLASTGVIGDARGFQILVSRIIVILHTQIYNLARKQEYYLVDLHEDYET